MVDFVVVVNLPYRFYHSRILFINFFDKNEKLNVNKIKFKRKYIFSFLMKHLYYYSLEDYKMSFELIYPNDIKPKITYKKCIILHTSFIKESNKYDNIKEKVKEMGKMNENFEKEEKIRERIRSFNHRDIIHHQLLFNIFESPFIIYDKINFDIKRDTPVLFDKIELIQVKDKKYENIRSNMLPTSLYLQIKDLSYKEQIDKLYVYYYKIIYKLYDYLKIGGNYQTDFMGSFDDKKIEIIYVLSLLFKKVIIQGYNSYICYGYLGEERLKREELEEIIKRKNCCVIPKPNIDKMIDYMTKEIKYEIKMNELLLKKKYKEYHQLYIVHYLLFLKNVSIDNPLIYELILNTEKYNIHLPNDYFQNYLMSNMENELKEIVDIFYDYKNKFEINGILEIGMGLGVYTKYIIEWILKENKKKGNITKYELTTLLIDEKEIWKNIGIDYVGKKNLKYIHCIKEDVNDFLEKKSKLKILEKYFYQFIFIHHIFLFEKFIYMIHILDKLLFINGLIIFEKSNSVLIEKIILFMDMNYLHYERICNKSYIIYRKKDKDVRRNLNISYF